MGIQPIDLSTIYSQMDRMGQFKASEVQSANMAAREHLERTAQQQTQKAQIVTETKGNENSAKIKADVSQGGGAGQGLLQGERRQGKDAHKTALEDAAKTAYEIKDPKLGRRIDVTG